GRSLAWVVEQQGQPGAARAPRTGPHHSVVAAEGGGLPYARLHVVATTLLGERPRFDGEDERVQQVQVEALRSIAGAARRDHGLVGLEPVEVPQRKIEVNVGDNRERSGLERERAGGEQAVVRPQ